MATFVERVLALPAWAWFAAAFMSHTLGSETWYWMLLMPFVSLTRSIYNERLAAHVAGNGADGAETPPAASIPTGPEQARQQKKKA